MADHRYPRNIHVRKSWPRAATPTTLVPNWEGEFSSHGDWVNFASRRLTGCTGSMGQKVDAICVDTLGRRCAIGADFARAQEEGTFPVRYFFECVEPGHADQVPAEEATVWTAGVSTVETSKGKRHVAGWIRGCWALDFRVYDFDDEGYLSPAWCLTHRPTGFAGFALFASLDEAQAIVEELDGLGDWSREGQNASPAFTAAVSAIKTKYADQVYFSTAIWSPTFERSGGHTDG